MLRDYSVSDITNILSTIIQEDQSTLQDVWIYGKILETLPPNRLTLGDTGCSIDCRNDSKDPTLFVGLGPEKVYYAYGKVIVNPQKSKYRFAVTKIQPNPPPNFSKDLSSLTEELKQTIEQLGIVQVHGKISPIIRKGSYTLLHLKDANFNKQIDGEMIECAIRPGIKPKIDLKEGSHVRVRGQINIFQKASVYQITIGNVDDIMPGSSLEQCQCSGCPQCGNQCDRLREVANFESCATCLPRPPDELYKLCPECYAISPDHETKVSDAVYTYFDELQVNGFSPYIHIRNARSECKECQIQFGARNGIADVVLANGNGSFAAIAECKGAGYVGHGIEQLKSYLSATDTRFGIFANRADSNQWKFYENRGGNCIPEIDCSKFEAEVVEGVANRERLIDEIVNLNGKIAGLENQKSELHNAIGQVSQTKRNLIKRISNLTQQIETLENYKSELHKEIHRELDELLEEKMQRLERPLSDMRIELQKRGIVNWFKNLFSKENE